MNKTKYSDTTGGSYSTSPVPPGNKAFVLWREVLMAFISPTVMAGIGGLVTGDKILMMRALTTIGGISGLFALLIGLWLRAKGQQKRWLVRTPQLIVVVLFALGGCMLGFLSAFATTSVLTLVNPTEYSAWSGHIWTDFPLSATIASTIISWRWRSSIKK
ncbi:hypothetical protein [Paenibacillus azoreducens]|uniref:Uncharacterized protein n=1 Tax=Paenibacillus azoreducens TaxID=116718 RepID=A0A919YEU9_9BACL|nr:hypothetical protein [Paenibacillus azoreducens]GIO49169.1 hypothetical protein J34TS1_39340 [Paenibacillus azoreducens]